jgi:hypothetical protein
MNDITSYKRRLRRKYGINLEFNDYTVEDLEKAKEKLLKKKSLIEDELALEKDSGKLLKTTIKYVITLIDEEIASLKLHIIKVLLDYKKTGKKFDFLMSSLNKNAKSLQSLIIIRNSFADIQFSKYIDNPFSDEYILTSDIVYNISLLNLNGNKPFNDEEIDKLFSELRKEFSSVKEELSKDSVNSCKKSLDEIKEEKQNIKVNGLRNLSKTIEELVNSINQELKVKQSLADFGLEPVNFFHSKLLDMKFNQGDIRLKKLIDDCTNLGVVTFKNMNIHDIVDKLNKLQYYKALRITLVEYLNMLPKSFNYGDKNYSNDNIRNKINKIIDYIDNCIEKINISLEESYLEEYEKLVSSADKLVQAKKEYDVSHEKLREAKGRIAVEEASYETEIADKKLTQSYQELYKASSAVGLTEDDESKVKDDRVEENNQKRALYQMKAEERMIARNSYYQSGAFLKISFAEYLRRIGKNELAELEEYIIKMLEDIYAQYEATDKSITFKQFLNYNEELKNMLEGFVTPYDLEEFIKNKEKSKSK